MELRVKGQEDIARVLYCAVVGKRIAMLHAFIKKAMTHDELKKAALERLEVKAGYEALEAEFSLLQQMLRARQQAGLSQAQVAERMGTQPPAVARLESSLSSGRHSPSIATLRKYAEAVGCHLEIKLIPEQAKPNEDLQRGGRSQEEA